MMGLVSLGKTAMLCALMSYKRVLHMLFSIILLFVI